MKKYNAPEMKTMAFVSEETIAIAEGAKSNPDGSNIFNDAEFGGW